MVSCAAELAQKRDNSNPGLAEGGLGSIVGQGRTSIHPDEAGPGTSDDLDSRRRARGIARRDGMTPPTISGQLTAGTKAVSREAQACMKLELAIASPARARGDGGRTGVKLVASSNGLSNVGGGSSSGCGSAKRLRRTMSVLSGYVLVVEEAVTGETKAAVEFECGVSACSPQVSAMTSKRSRAGSFSRRSRFPWSCYDTTGAKPVIYWCIYAVTHTRHVFPLAVVRVSVAYAGHFFCVGVAASEDNIYLWRTVKARHVLQQQCWRTNSDRLGNL